MGRATVAPLCPSVATSVAESPLNDQPSAPESNQSPLLGKEKTSRSPRLVTSAGPPLYEPDRFLVPRSLTMPTTPLPTVVGCTSQDAGSGQDANRNPSRRELTARSILANCSTVLEHWPMRHWILSHLAASTGAPCAPMTGLTQPHSRSP